MESKITDIKIKKFNVCTRFSGVYKGGGGDKFLSIGRAIFRKRDRKKKKEKRKKARAICISNSKNKTIVLFVRNTDYTLRNNRRKNQQVINGISMVIFV